MSRRLTPASSRCVAHEWRNVCTEARLCMDAACLQSSAKGILHAVARHGGGGCGHPEPASARRWKKPHRIAVGCPVLAEQREGLLGQRHIAVLRPFAVAHVDDHPGTIDRKSTR